MPHLLSRRTATASLAGAVALAAGGRINDVLAQSGAAAPWPTDGWPTASPADQGMDLALPDAIDAALVELPTVTGVVVIHNGYLVSEHYPGAYERDDPINIRSVTKSVVATLIGIALRRQDLDSLDQTVGDLIPDRIPDDADPAVADVTLRDLLTMTSGIAWDASSDYPRLIASDNYVELTLGQPLANPPGDVYVYNSGGSHLLAVMLEAAIGEEIESYADRHLFDPLGIADGRWEESPQGEAIGGFGLHLTPRDMAKLGYLYLRGGAWDGARIIPREYHTTATTVQSAGDSTGGTPYGYQWWVTDATGFDAYFALGFGSQYIYVVPELDLVAVTAVGFEEDTRPDQFFAARPLIEQLIIPSTFS
ncbi:MAG: serine hydrolase [Chloroflexia bacterium]|nr:serine hydrolase [Chloroflexia bacterium]